MQLHQFLPRLLVVALAFTMMGRVAKADPLIDIKVVVPVVHDEYQHTEAPAFVVVAEAPPTEIVVDVQPERPSPNHVWAAGAWFWNGNKYEWHHGQWLLPPAGFGVWVAPRYEHRADGHYVAAGYWQHEADHGHDAPVRADDHRDKADDHRDKADEHHDKGDDNGKGNDHGRK